MAKALTDRQRKQQETQRARLQRALDRRGRLPFGSLRVLASGRVQARYTGPDGRRYTAPRTWDNLTDAGAWLDSTERKIRDGAWLSPDAERDAERQAASEARRLNDLFADYMREGDLKPRTVDLYESQWRRFVRDGIGERAAASITPSDVADWRETLPEAPRQRQQTGDLLRAVLGLAVERELIGRNPASITRRKTKDRRSRSRDAERTFRLTPEQVAAAAEAMPAARRFAVLLTAGTGLRFGEMAALRRSDLDVERNEEGQITRVRMHVRRAVERARGEDGVRRSVEGSPKSDAGTRSLVIPPRLHADLEDHLARHAAPEEGGLLFPGTGGALLTPTTLYGETPGSASHGGKRRPTKGRGWYRARVEAGVPNARWHLLRHFAISEAVDQGATPAVLLSRFGHTDMATSAIYQHATETADAELADRL